MSQLACESEFCYDGAYVNANQMPLSARPVKYFTVGKLTKRDVVDMPLTDGQWKTRDARYRQICMGLTSQLGLLTV